MKVRKGLTITLLILLVLICKTAFSAPAYAASNSFTIKLLIKQAGSTDMSGYMVSCGSQATPNQQIEQVNHDGTVEFTINNLSSTVNNQIYLYDHAQQILGGFVIKLNSGKPNSVTVQGSPKLGYLLTVDYSEHTKTIVLNTIINQNTYWEYRTLDFIVQSVPSQPTQPQTPTQPPQQPDHEADPPSNEAIEAPDIKGEEPPPNEIIEDPDMAGEAPQHGELIGAPAVRDEEPPPEEFFEDPDRSWNGQPGLSPLYFIAFAVVGIATIIGVIFLIKKKNKPANITNQKEKEDY